MVHVEPDYKVREYALGWYQKGVLKEENLQTVDTKLAEPVRDQSQIRILGKRQILLKPQRIKRMQQTHVMNLQRMMMRQPPDQKQSRNNFIAGIRKHLPWKVLF